MNKNKFIVVLILATALYLGTRWVSENETIPPKKVSFLVDPMGQKIEKPEWKKPETIIPTASSNIQSKEGLNPSSATPQETIPDLDPDLQYETSVINDPNYPNEPFVGPYDNQRFKEGVMKRVKANRAIQTFVVTEHNRLAIDDFNTMASDTDWILSLDEVPKEQKREVLIDFMWSHAVLVPKRDGTADTQLADKIRHYYNRLPQYLDDAAYFSQVKDFLISKQVLTSAN